MTNEYIILFTVEIIGEAQQQRQFIKTDKAIKLSQREQNHLQKLEFHPKAFYGLTNLGAPFHYELIPASVRAAVWSDQRQHIIKFHF